MRIDAAEYRALAGLRYLIHNFLSEADAAARRVGLEPQQYRLMLAVRGLPDDKEPGVQVLAERLALKHNTTVELIDRMERRGYVRRSRNADDRRRVLVTLQPRGERLLEKIARQRLGELRVGGPALVRAVNVLLERNRKSRRHTSHRKRPTAKRRKEKSE